MKVVIDGILTNYEEIGTGRHVFLILHGWGRSLVEWMPTAKLLSDRFTVIVLDLPGFGHTPKPHETWGIDDYAIFTEQFLHKLGISSCELLGHSFGGRIGIILAAKTNLLSRLFLVDAAGIENKDTITDLKVGINKLLMAPLKLVLPKHQIEKLKQRFGSSDYKTAGGMRDIFVKVIQTDLTPLLKEIPIPTIIIWGEKDTIVPVSHAQLMRKRIEHSVLRIVWGAGHSPHLDKKRIFEEILEDNLPLAISH